MLGGISHITFVVRDLDRTDKFFREVLGAEEVYDSGEQRYSLYREKFYTAGGQWIAVMETEEILNRTYHHVAFRVEKSSLTAYRKRIEQAGLEIKPSRSRVDGEGESIYFYDYDNNLFELHTGTLQERLAAYKKG
ncbi:FosX/FosE/FosI family fosfomycin resistance hydrolase [Terribacillus sp. DMT04]|uniref:FosX/FosE/FosI family fosfomycin resistance hydrolase n=1 Tax=Terribacillus sp. DMT04 TaxID=2850441 RepID=UPI001C2C0873|nr:FosX/FosE/FosI family fosfomycin resistance hydrolase [Terribacillus sp. DMT04]QXE03363.1 FosX/FosE/FosI family fosfomycin resistance hydrolase [Terribacillus sp. DMT04]